VQLSSELASALGLRNGETPFPWQERLFVQFCAGEIPGAVDIPTGLGKTAVIALWLVARATGARLPRRLVYVVDRRAVVDQATEVAEALRAWVDANGDVRERLGLRGPMPISTLRGQHLDNKRWLEDPGAPSIIVGTVDMVGSRLLFGGYGVSRKMRPFHAGLLGLDALVVLDEAHLVPPFEHLLESIGAPELAATTDLRGSLPLFRVLSLSATGRSRTEGVLTIDASDEQHPVAARRLGADKKLTFEPPHDAETLPGALARQALALARSHDGPRRCIVFCDKRDDAVAVAGEIQAISDKKRNASEVSVELFVGGRRAHERADAAMRLEELGFLARSDEPPSAPSILVATSAGEVGVDLDAEDMVCDLVAWERMVQRLGRVNRRGKHASRVVVVAAPSKEPDEQERRDATRAAIEQLPNTPSGYDVSPRALGNLKKRAELADLIARASTPPPLRPALSRAVVEAWSMTSLAEHAGRPTVQPWLRGWIEEEVETSIVLRRHLPVHAATASRGEPLSVLDVQRFFEATPVHASEVVDVPTYRAISWLLARARAAAQSGVGDHEAVAFILNGAGEHERTVSIRDVMPPKDAEKKTRDALHRALSARTLVVDARLGGLSRGLIDEDSNEEPVTADTDTVWGADVGFRVDTIASGTQPSDTAGWRERLRIVVERSFAGDPVRELRVCRFEDDAATEDDRSEGNWQSLDEHQAWAEERARQLADRLQLSPNLTQALTVAARLHDEGKRSKRWQRAFSARPDAVYAKTPGPLRVALLDGYRHELGSIPFAERDPEVAAMPAAQRDLVLHLIAAHHGHARPTIDVRGCDDAPPSLLAKRAREIALRFARMEKIWGPWGLAWLEAVLRAADQQASRDNDAREETR